MFCSHRHYTLIHIHTGSLQLSFSHFWAFLSCHLLLDSYKCNFCCDYAVWHAFIQLYNVFCTIFWSNSWLICNMHWLSLQACSWVSGHALRRGYCCLRFPLENRRSMSLCKYTTAVHTSSLTLRYIMVMDRCVFVYATQRLQTFKCNRSQPLHQACIIYQYHIVYRLTLAISFNDIEYLIVHAHVHFLHLDYICSQCLKSLNLITLINVDFSNFLTIVFHTIKYTVVLIHCIIYSTMTVFSF